MDKNEPRMTAAPGLAPQPWFKEPCLLGVDEAGRGPVLGSMVYACAFAPLSEANALKKSSFADSKTLTAERRDALFDHIQNDSKMGYFVDEISAAAISGAMLGRQRISLNVMAAESTCRLISAVLAAGVNLQEIYVDTVGAADTYKQKLSSNFPGIQFTVCPKADALFPIVSAASIVAKVTRDRSLVEATEGAACGSGYPADPVTKSWLESNIEPTFGYQAHVRFSWGTCTTLLEKNCAQVEWECEEEGDVQQPSLTKLLRGDGKKLKARHSYFRTRKLQRVSADNLW